MAINRYRNTDVIDNKYYGTINFPTKEQLDAIPVYQIYVNKFERLDNLAAKYFGGEGSLWWVIAIMNDLEWGFSFSEGQVIKIPIDIQDVLRLM